MNDGMPLSIEALIGIVAAEVLLDAIKTSALLTQLGVPHALIGGLAIGLYGHPRATKDVDYLVDDSAFASTKPLLVYRQELATVVKMGVVDLLAIPTGRAVLRELLELPNPGVIPVIGLPALVMMKLDAGRTQDMADINAVLDAGANPDIIGMFLAESAPDLRDQFAELLDRRSRKVESEEQ